MLYILKLLGFMWSIVIGALAGAYAGAENTEKSIRRIGIPVMLTLASLGVLLSVFGSIGWLALTVMSMAGVFSIGYGIPDANDDGSALGKFWYKVTKGNHFWSDVLTRGTIGVACCTSFVAIAIVGKILLAYLIGCAIIIGSYILFGAIIKNEGMFTFLGKRCLWEEAYIYGTICGVVSFLLLLLI